MGSLKCVMCETKNGNKSNDIYFVKSSYSKILLIDLIENYILKSKLVGYKSTCVCDNCLKILNDYDYTRQHLEVIYKKVLSFFKIDYTSTNVSCQTDISVINARNFTQGSNSACENTQEQRKNDLHHKYFCDGLVLSLNGTDFDRTGIKEIVNKNNSTYLNKKEEYVETFDICEPEEICLQECNTADSEKEECEILEIIETNNIEDTKYVCPLCSKEWNSQDEYKRHRKSVHKVTNIYTCEICGQSYKHRHALKIHIGMHNGICPFKCQYCNKTFTQKAALNRHLPRHTGETPFVCDVCGKGFIHHSSFNIHKLSHTKEKKYKCTLCEKSFMSSSHLRRHIKVHTNEKKYTCSVCERSFAEKYNLVAHQKVHSNVPKQTFQCQVCPQKFPIRNKLHNHLKQKHHIVTEVDVNSLKGVFGASKM